MTTLNPQYITDKNGKKTAVILKIKEYQKILEELEDIEDVTLYDDAKKEDDGTRIELRKYLSNRKKKND
ncbi:hypothetical protein [Epilithonimonas sp.]|uniref:hypothetical protein n=1 Tax=Epilithonimonas sp. TaxID=2894511 RepID=UPI0035AF8B4E